MLSPKDRRSNTMRTALSFALSCLMVVGPVPAQALDEIIEEVNGEAIVELDQIESPSIEIQETTDSVAEMSASNILTGLPEIYTEDDILYAAFHAIADKVSINEELYSDVEAAGVAALKGSETTSEGVTYAFVVLVQKLGLNAEYLGDGDAVYASVVANDTTYQVDIAASVKARMSSGETTAKEPWLSNEDANEDTVKISEDEPETEDAETDDGSENSFPLDDSVGFNPVTPLSMAGDVREEDLSDLVIQGELPLSLTTQATTYTPVITHNVYETESDVNALSDYPRKSYLHTNSSGKLERVEFLKGEDDTYTLYVETLSADMRSVTSQKVIDPSTYMPSDLVSPSNFCWGGFYSGSKYNFIVTGQTNNGHDNALTEVRITRYSKTWSSPKAFEFNENIGSFPYKAKKYDGDKHGMAVPFRQGSAALYEQSGQLHLRTSTLLFNGHQSSVQIVVNESDMSFVDSMVYVMNPTQAPYGYISHSFGQRLSALDGVLYGIDHGDANPRAIHLKEIGNSSKDRGSDGGSLEVFPIGGATMNNVTHLSLGGFETSSDKSTMLVECVTIDQNNFNSASLTSPRNVLICVCTPKSSSTSLAVKNNIYYTNFSSTSTTGAMYPKLVKINENRFLVMWSEFATLGANIRISDSRPTNQTGTIGYVFIDGNGNMLGSVQKGEAYLSGCEPVLHDGKIVWFAEDVDGSHSPIYYAIDQSTGALECLTAKNSIADATIQPIADQFFTGDALTPKPTVTFAKKTLAEGVDYTLSYSNNTKVGTGTVTVTGLGNFSGTQTAQFNIQRGKVTITASDKTLVMGTTQNVDAVASKGAGNFVYTPADTSIIKVSSSGVITPLRVGSTTLNITTKETTSMGAGSASIKVNVIKGAAEITCPSTNLDVQMGSTTNLGAKVSSDATISYESADASIATVSATGVVTPVKVGSTKITLYAPETTNYDSATVTVTVNVVSGTPGISCSSSKSVAMGKTVSLGATAESGGALTYKSSNTNIVQVDTTGKLTPVHVGNATVTVTSAATGGWDAATKDVAVTVTQGTPTISCDTVTVPLGSTATLEPEVSNGAGAISFASSDESIVKVNATTGALEPVGVGSAKITVSTAATADWKAATKDVTVTVGRAAATITSVSSLQLTMGTTGSLRASANQGAGALTYRSSSTAVATVDSTGTVTPKGAGSCEITITAAASTAYDKATKVVPITVTSSGPSISVSDVVVCMGETGNVGAEIVGGGKVTYSSSDTSIVKVAASTGVLTPVSVGVATVTINVAATSGWDAATAEVEVSVERGTPQISASDFSLAMGATRTGWATVSSGAPKPTYSSSNEQVATVDTTSGKVTPVHVGTCTLTAIVSATSEWKAAKKQVTLTVTKGTPVVKVSDKKVAMGKTASASASTSSGYTLSYSVGDTLVATVNESGTITPVHVGATALTVSDPGGADWLPAKATSTITVTQGTPTITLASTTVTVPLNGTALAGASVTPGAGALSYTSDAPSVATVDQNGVVKPASVGSTRVTITSASNEDWANASKTLTVKVINSEQTIKVNDVLVVTGETASLNAVLQEGDGKLSYRSASTAVAKVSSAGVVTGVAPGRTTITVTAAATTNWSKGTAEVDVIVVDALPNTSSDGWRDLGTVAKAYAKGGSLVKGWFDLGSGKYYFRTNNSLVTGWYDVQVGNNKMHYYFNERSGNMARNTWMTIDGINYYFRPSGNMATGFADIVDGGVTKKYYFDASGQLVTGWADVVIGGNTMHYYFRPSGALATGWATIDGINYYFRPSGNMATGWADVGTNKYYFDERGRMVTGWREINGGTYYFRASGAMQTGKATIDGVTYTFSDSGRLIS